MNALGVRARVQIWVEVSIPFSEAVVVDTNAVHRRGIRTFFRGAMYESAAQTLCVGFRDETTTGCSWGQNARHFQCHQLRGVASCAENVQVVANRVDLLQGKVPKNSVQDLR